jgi:tetratricopeptide (TPR) repeat protein
VKAESDNSTLANALLSANQSGDEARIESLLTEHFVESVALASGPFMDDYLKALGAGDHAAAEKTQDLLQRVARFSAKVKGDHYLSDLLRFLISADANVIGKVKEVRRLLREGERNQNDGKYENAIARYSEASRLADRIGDVCHSEVALCSSASIYMPQLETPDRLVMRENLVSETANRDHKQLQAKALLGLANLYDPRQLISKMLTVSSQAYEIANRLGDTDMVINSLRFVGAAYSRLGNDEAAIENNFAALRLLLRHGMSSRRACQVYSQTAKAFSLVGQPSSALAYQLEAFQHCDGKTPLSYSAAIRGNAGLYYSQTGRYEEAARMMNEAISLAEKYDDRAGRNLLLSDLHISLGEIYLRQARYDDAISAYRVALNLISGSDHLRYLSAIHEGLAIAYREQGRFEPKWRERISITPRGAVLF